MESLAAFCFDLFHFFHFTQSTPFFNAGFNDPLISNPIMLVNFSPVEMQVIDPQGRRAGMDFETWNELSEIPNAFFSRSDEPHEPDFIFIPDGLEGDYQIELLGTGEGEYRIQMDKLSEDGIFTIADFSGSTSTGQEHHHEITYDDSLLPGSALTIEWLPPLSDQEESRKVNQNSTLPIKFTVHDEEGKFIVDNNALVWVVDPLNPDSTISAFSTDKQGLRGLSDIIRIDPEEEQYIVNLKLKDYKFDPGKIYQVGVSIYGQQLETSSFTVVSP